MLNVLANGLVIVKGGGGRFDEEKDDVLNYDDK